MRCTAPPSSSVITNGGKPAGAARSRSAIARARSGGAAEPNRMTPPAPDATSARTAPTSASATGTTIVCAARRARLHVERMRDVVHAAVEGGTVDASVAEGRGVVAADDDGGLGAAPFEPPAHAARSVSPRASARARVTRRSIAYPGLESGCRDLNPGPQRPESEKAA